MTTDKPNFKRQADGSLLERELDGSYRPTASLTDRSRVDALTDDQIDGMARADPDHPAPDDAFWAGVDQTAMKQAVSLKLDGDIPVVLP